jgi:hypothetical protein
MFNLRGIDPETIGVCLSIQAINYFLESSSFMIDQYRMANLVCVVVTNQNFWFIVRHRKTPSLEGRDPSPQETTTPIEIS